MVDAPHLQTEGWQQEARVSIPTVALSLKQPWPVAIFLLRKRIENRSRNTNYRGDFLIHASKGFDSDGWFWIKEQAKQHGWKLPRGFDDEDWFPRGGIVGRARVSNVLKFGKDNADHHKPWFFGPYGYELADVEEVPFVPCSGSVQLFWRVPSWVRDAIERKLKEAA